MTNRKLPASSYRPIKLKTAKEQRGPYRVPDPPKFTDIPGSWPWTSAGTSGTRSRRGMTADHRAAWKDAITAAKPERLVHAARIMEGVDLGIDPSHS